jgi:hypothetical protein
VAKELLLQFNAEGTLREYSGWITAPKARDLIEEFFTYYTARYNLQFEAPPAPDVRTTASDLRDLVDVSPDLFGV